MRATIKLKLTMTFVLLLTLLGTVIYFGSSRMNLLNVSITKLVDGPAAQLDRAHRIDTKVSMVIRAEKNLLLLDNKQDRAPFQEKIDTQKAEIEKLVEAGNSHASPAAKASWEKLRDGWEKFKPENQKVRDLVETNLDAAKSVSLKESRLSAEALSNEVTALVTVNENLMQKATEDTESLYHNARSTMFAIGGFAVVISAALAFYLGMLISRGLKAAGEALSKVAEGDLTRLVEVKSKDEIGELLDLVNRMIERLRSVVGDAGVAAENVSTGSQELSASAEQVSQGATEQAAAAEQASASMEEMAANIKQNADNAAQTEKIARQSSKDAEASGVAVTRAVDAMQTIADKIGIVQEIARQTDLLALNAAVEAARAGEHGRGFAVVASEVRKLAERSQVAAAEISSVSADTVKAATEAGEMLTKLVPDIRRTAELVTEISAACREQDIGSSQINEAIRQLDHVTQRNAGASEEISSTSEELASQAEELQASIGYFRVLNSAETRRPLPIAVKKTSAKTAKGGRSKPNSVADQQARAKGFALELTAGGPDEDDDTFGVRAA